MSAINKLASIIFDIIAEVPSVLSVAFSRKSFHEKSIMLEFGFKPWQINRTLKRFASSGYIKNRNSKFYLTQKGLIRVNFYKLRNIQLNLNKKWNGRWRLIIFDIPESIRFIRDVLRSKLREWDCYKIQNSVFVCPFECEKEVSAINKILETEYYVHVFLTDSLGKAEKRVRRYYKL